MVVSFKVAKLLDRLGYSENCANYYNIFGELQDSNKGYYPLEYYLAPTVFSAVNWLFKHTKFKITTTVSKNLKGVISIVNIEKGNDLDIHPLNLETDIEKAYYVALEYIASLENT